VRRMPRIKRGGNRNLARERQGEGRGGRTSVPINSHDLHEPSTTEREDAGRQGETKKRYRNLFPRTSGEIAAELGSATTGRVR